MLRCMLLDSMRFSLSSSLSLVVIAFLQVGQYCLATNQKNVSTNSTNQDDLFIHNAAEPMSVSMESSLSLPCVVKAKNKQARNSVKFVWKRDGRILNNTRFSISNFSCKYEVLELLTINKIRKLDRGTYECHVEIGRTKLNTSWTIRVIDEHKSVVSVEWLYISVGVGSGTTLFLLIITICLTSKLRRSSNANITSEKSMLTHSAERQISDSSYDQEANEGHRSKEKQKVEWKKRKSNELALSSIQQKDVIKMKHLKLPYETKYSKSFHLRKIKSDTSFLPGRSYSASILESNGYRKTSDTNDPLYITPNPVPTSRSKSEKSPQSPKFHTKSTSLSDREDRNQPVYQNAKPIPRERKKTPLYETPVIPDLNADVNEVFEEDEDAYPYLDLTPMEEDENAI